MGRIPKKYLNDASLNILIQMYFVYLEIIINFIIFKSKLDFIQENFYFSSRVSSEMNFKSKMHGIFVF